MIDVLVPLLVANAPLLDVVAPGKFLGRWNTLDLWETQEREIEPGRKVCITYSRRRQGFLSSVYFMFGASNEVGLLTSTPIKSSAKVVSLDYGTSYRRMISSSVIARAQRVGADYLIRNPYNSESMGALLKEIRSAKSVSLKVDGTEYAIPLDAFAKAYEEMQACERHRLNMVLRD